MILRVLRRTPDARDAKLSAATIGIVVGTVHATPCVAATNFDAPAARFGMPESVLDVLLGMPGSAHFMARRVVRGELVVN
jgi:enoyl-CoA hydratase/carnithine racemase